jgi:hypothetical protein
MLRTISKIAMLLVCLQLFQASTVVVAAPASAPAHALVGNWYNADYGIYPDFAMLTLATDGTAAITGIDGRRRSGDHKLGPDGRLVIRMADDSQPPKLRVIIDSLPLLDGERLQLQSKRRTFYFSRARWLKAEVDKAMERYRPPKVAVRPQPPTVVVDEESAKADAAEVAKRKPEAARPAPAVREPEPEPEPPPRVIKRLWLRLVGEGAGPDGCSQPVREALAQAWEPVGSREQADAVVEINLSGIHYERSVWVGQYYKINYQISLKDAKSGDLLGEEEGSERASGDGMMEVCEDVAEDIAEEVEDLIEAVLDD